MGANESDKFSFTFPSRIYCFEICVNDFATNLIGVVTEKTIVLGQLKQLESSEIIEWEVLKNIYHEYPSRVIAFAPETSLVSIPKVVTFCVAGGKLLRLYRTDLQNSDTVQVLDGHTNYVNDVAWQYEGKYLASVSDDYTCRIWDTELNYDNIITFCLLSAGMSVKWHPEEMHKLLVAEKKGIVRLYNVSSQQAIICVETHKWPLMYADWSLSNRNHVTALTTEILTWDLRFPCALRNAKQVYEKSGQIVRYSPQSELILATIGSKTLKVCTLKSNLPLLEVPLKLYGGLCWHSRLPYIAAASDNKLCFWRVQIK